MTAQELLNNIGIKKELIEAEDGSLLINFDDSNAYLSAYNKLDLSELVSLHEDEMILSEHNHLAVYSNDEYIITIVADFNHDTYNLTVKEV